jgi:hypothetical protein
MEKESASETLCIFQKLDDGQSPPPKKKILSVTFSHAVFSLLDFLTPEDGTNRFSRNVGKEFTNQRCIISHNRADIT